jgi:hypothetical protein
MLAEHLVVAVPVSEWQCCFGGGDVSLAVAGEWWLRDAAGSLALLS